jgi:hypothetical protein
MFDQFIDAQDKYFQNKKLPALVIHDFLSEIKYKEMFDTLQSIDIKDYDRYENPFEKKYTLKKLSFPNCVVDFLESFESEEFMKVLKSYYPDKKICRDTYHHYWGVHKFGKGDSLAIHADAGVHPLMNKPKFLTIGFYLNKEWNETLKANLELWEGDSLQQENPEIIHCYKEIHTLANTLVMFENSEFGWHGASESYQGDLKINPRYFVTLSLMLDENPTLHHNKRRRAYFAKRRGTTESAEIQDLRKRRADNQESANVYRINIKN